MGINHGGHNIFVTQKLLDGADIIPVLQQVGGETMPESMTACRLRCAAGPDGVFDGVLQISFRDLVPAFFAAAWVYRDLFRRENVLPGPLARGFRVFPM